MMTLISGLPNLMFLGFLLIGFGLVASMASWRFEPLKALSIAIAKSVFSAALIAVVALGLVGCAAVPAHQVEVAKPKVDPPVKIVCLHDKTASTQWTRVEQATSADFEPLMELVCSRGGELSVGLIRDSSNRGLLRLRLPQPPEAPVEPDRHMNPFLLSEAQAAYARQKSAYDEQLNQQQAQVEQSASEFADQLEKLLAQPADAQHTDVWGAITRGELFMGEPDDTWSIKPHKYIIAVTDGLDNVHGQKVQIQSGAQLLLVNSSASLGDLAELKPLRFESVASAVQYLVAHERR